MTAGDLLRALLLLDVLGMLLLAIFYLRQRPLSLKISGFRSSLPNVPL